MDWPVLKKGEILVWHADLDGDDASLRRLSAFLSPEERERASRFHFEKDRTRYARCHGILRVLVGRYAGIEPARLSLVKEHNGKPKLEEQPESRAFSFNLSHSDDRAIFGFCIGQPIGVDIERLRSVPDAAQMVESYFSTAEKAIFRAAPVSERDATFLALWTKKEAYLKALGEGLSHALDADPDPKEGWRIEAISLSKPGFMAAVATKGVVGKITVLQWGDSELVQ